MDLLLIRRCQAGDQEAFATLFRAYKDLVYRTAYLLLGSAPDAEDALQEVFLQVHRSLGTFDPARGAFTTWLHRVTVNHCLNRRRTRRLFALSLDAPSSTRPDPSTPFPSDQIGEEEAVRQAWGRLSDKLRAVIVLRYYAELSYAEVAQVLDVPIGTVKSRLDLALRTLRHDLAPPPHDAPVPRALHGREAAK